jgi:hypothetical protein
LLLAADFWYALGMWAALGANGPLLPFVIVLSLRRGVSKADTDAIG